MNDDVSLSENKNSECAACRSRTFDFLDIMHYQCQEYTTHISKNGHFYFRYSIMRECWEGDPSKRPTFQWLCSATKRLLDDHKVCLKYFPEVICLFFHFYIKTSIITPLWLRLSLSFPVLLENGGSRDK